jgi:hypothetical protein
MTVTICETLKYGYRTSNGVLRQCFVALNANQMYQSNLIVGVTITLGGESVLWVLITFQCLEGTFVALAKHKQTT